MKISSLFLAAILSLVAFSTFAETINLNKADAAAFQYYLTGIGKVKSMNIVEYRKEHAKFNTIEEIKEVKGIGEIVYNKIKSSLSLTKGVVSAPAKAIAKKAIKIDKKKGVKEAKSKN